MYQKKGPPGLEALSFLPGKTGISGLLKEGEFTGMWRVVWDAWATPRAEESERSGSMAYQRISFPETNLILKIS